MIKIEADINSRTSKVEAEGSGTDIICDAALCISALVNMLSRNGEIPAEIVEGILKTSYKSLKESTSKIISMDATAFRKD